MAKPEWGTKRICLSCGARFYDMNRDPIVCPACGATLDLTTQSRPRRSRAAAKPVAVVPEEVEVEETESTTGKDEDEEETADESADSDEEESDSAIEDVSELGDDDMTDVIDTEIENDEGER